MNKQINARNVELYIGKIDDMDAFKPSQRDSLTLAKYVDNAITATTLKDFMKFSSLASSISIEPEEDDTSTSLRFGIDSDGAQNSITTITFNSDVDVTLTVDETILQEMKDYILEKLDISVTDFPDYKAFNYASMSKDNLVLLVRKKLTIGEDELYSNILIVNPTPLKPISTEMGSDDDEQTQDIELLAKKGRIHEDVYSKDAVAEVLNFEDEESA